MKHNLVALLLFVLALAHTPLTVSAQRARPHSASSQTSSKAKRPNIIYILADDLGWADVGYHGGEVKTPNIDRLAASGVRLEQFYVQPVCTPTRASLMTGRYPMRQGLQVDVIRPWQKRGLPLDERTLPQALKEVGYKTAILGKWHLGHGRTEYLPTRRGFDYQYGSYVSPDQYTHNAGVGRRWQATLDWHRNDKALREEGYTTELLTQDAIRYVKERDKSKPFFLYLAYAVPHVPLQAPADYVGRYTQLADKQRRTYAAMVTYMDEQIGKFLSALDEQGVRDDTLIVFSSDNGGSTTYGHASNGALRGGKGSLYEGGVRVPAFAVWRGKLKAGAIVNEPLHMVDWFPTLLRLAGATLKQPLPLDGLDAWSTIAEGKRTPHEEFLVNTTPTSGALRYREWKLIINGAKSTDSEGSRNAGKDAGDLIELFNIAQDPFEKTNLAEKYPEKVLELRKRLDALARQAVAPISAPDTAQEPPPEVLGESKERIE